MYQTNYVAGLRIIDVSDPENPVEVASFDTVPYGPNDNSPVLGAWSSYPFFKSGLIVVTSGREGVFFLKRGRKSIPKSRFTFSCIQDLFEPVHHWQEYILRMVRMTGRSVLDRDRGGPL